MMRRVHFVALCLLGALLAPAAQAASPESTATSLVRDDEVVVAFRRGTAPAEIQAIHRSLGTRELRQVRALRVRVVRTRPGQARTLLARYRSHPAVEYAELNGIARAAGHAADPLYPQQWALNNTGQTGGTPDADVDAPQAWDVTRGAWSGDAAVTTVAIVDSGIAVSHPDLIGSVLASMNFTSSPAGSLDVFGHGTHVAGIVAAHSDNGEGVSGVCPACQLLNVKVLDDHGIGDYDRIASGILWAAGCDLTPCGPPRARTILLALGGGFDSILVRQAVELAWNNGVLLSCAAGNRQGDYFPAQYPTCIATGSSDHNDQPAPDSNAARWVDVGAPGVLILSSGAGGGYEVWSGTSMAAAHAAGLAGLLWSQELDTPGAVRRQLEWGADPTRGHVWAKGRLNACKAVGGRDCQKG